MDLYGNSIDYYYFCICSNFLLQSHGKYDRIFVINMTFRRIELKV